MIFGKIIIFKRLEEMNKTMEKSYKISRVILAVMAFIIFNIMFINEDVSWKILPPIFTVIVFGVSYPSSVISRLLINIGNKLESKLLKILYYVIVLPIISFLLFGGICAIMFFILETLPTPNELSAGLSQVLWVLFWIAVGAICIIVPYIQTLIVLILKCFVKT